MVKLQLRDLYDSGSLVAEVDMEGRFVKIQTVGAVSLSKNQACRLLDLVKGANLQEGHYEGDEYNGWDPLCKSVDENGNESIYLHIGALMYKDDAKKFAAELEAMLKKL